MSIDRSHQQRLRAALVAAVTCTCMGAGVAHAQSLQASAGNGNPMFVSGGVGVESRAQLATIEPNANLKLVFTETRGEFLSNVGVTVTNQRGQVLIDTVSAGPWLIARLDPGTYKIVAREGGITQERVVPIGQRLRTEQFRFAMLAP